MGGKEPPPWTPAVLTQAVEGLSRGLSPKEAAHGAAALWPEVNPNESEVNREIRKTALGATMDPTIAGYRSTMKAFLEWWLLEPTQARQEEKDPFSMANAKRFLLWMSHTGRRIGKSLTATSSALRFIYLSYSKVWAPDWEYSQLLKGVVSSTQAEFDRKHPEKNKIKFVFEADVASKIAIETFVNKSMSRMHGALFTFAFATALRASQVLNMETKHWSITMEDSPVGPKTHLRYQTQLKKQKGNKRGLWVARTISNKHLVNGTYKPELGDWVQFMANFVRERTSAGATLLFGELLCNPKAKPADSSQGKAKGKSNPKLSESTILKDTVRELLTIVGVHQDLASDRTTGGHSTRRSAATSGLAAGVHKDQMAWLGTWEKTDSMDPYLANAVARTAHTKHWFGHLRDI